MTEKVRPSCLSDGDRACASGTSFDSKVTVLFGGRPLPGRRLAIRVLIIAFVVTQAPRIWSSSGVLLDQFGRMGTEDVEARLPEMPHWRGGRVPQDVECGPGTPGWDYICTFIDPFVPSGSFTTPPPGWKPKRLKVGVRVGAQSIKSVSQTLELDARWIMP